MARRPVRVCTLVSSYEESDSELKVYEGDLAQTPQYYFTKEDEEDYVFTLVYVRKATTYRQIRHLVKSCSFDVFYNQCDGAIDEDKAGVDVVQALESFHVPFTGAISKYYELSKPEMKRLAAACGITTAPHAVLESGDDARAICAPLRFPLLIKHISGYSSVGMDRSCKVHTMDALAERVALFIAQYECALVEEFVAGDEATALVCADASQPGGVRVFPPAMMQFPPGEDFKHFHLKWESYEGMEWKLMPEDDPALADIMRIARLSFVHMMGKVGYGRVDVRIDRVTNTVVFLEINPNCGVMYPYGQEGSADWILRLNPDFKQKEFAKLQIHEAILRQERIQPLFRCAYSPSRGYYMCATRNIAAGEKIYEAEGRSVRLFTKPYLEDTLSEQESTKFFQSALSLDDSGHYYAMWDCESSHWQMIKHSCRPNVTFGANRSLNLVAFQDISKGEELTLDYRSVVGKKKYSAKCHCASQNCSGWTLSSVETNITAGCTTNAAPCAQAVTQKVV